jgi:hypothetical protein
MALLRGDVAGAATTIGDGRSPAGLPSFRSGKCEVPVLTGCGSFYGSRPLGRRPAMTREPSSPP